MRLILSNCEADNFDGSSFSHKSRSPLCAMEAIISVKVMCNPEGYNYFSTDKLIIKGKKFERQLTLHLVILSKALFYLEFPFHFANTLQTGDISLL